MFDGGVSGGGVVHTGRAYLITGEEGEGRGVAEEEGHTYQRVGGGCQIRPQLWSILLQIWKNQGLFETSFEYVLTH